MKFFFKTHSSVSNSASENGVSAITMVLFLKTLFLFVCLLFLPLFISLYSSLFRYLTLPFSNSLLCFSNNVETLEESLQDEECYETPQSLDEETETPFSALRFRFPTYEEFLSSRENGDSAILITSNSSEESEAIAPNLQFGEDDFTESINEKFDIEDEKPEHDVSNDSVKTKSKSSCNQKSEDSNEPSDLKARKIEENYDHRELMDEILKAYEIYRENMGKFDALNHQKLNATDLKQSKGSLLFKSLRLCRPKGDRELHGDLEMVYVGQLCLSWDFILWQYNKALDLREIDPLGRCRYSKVAGQFQHFQLLIQRFIKNEPFQSSRVEYYAKTRLAMRKLLQVPVIREDKVKDRKSGRTKEKDDEVTIDMLVEMLQESMRTFWQLIRADKQSQMGAKSDGKSPAHSMILKGILSDLQKKDGKLKKMVKSKSWLLKNLKEDEADDELCFLSQVDLKLVSRVVNMQRITTDQLAWCRDKLGSISFLDRETGVGPSFFFFPC